MTPRPVASCWLRQPAVTAGLGSGGSETPAALPGLLDRWAACLSALGGRLRSAGCAAVRFGPSGHRRVVRGDGGEVLDEPAAPRGVPGQADLVGRDVADVAVGDVGAGVEDRGGPRQDDDAVARGPVLECLSP